MPCPTCGGTDARTELVSGYWRCDAVVPAERLVADAVGAGSPGAVDPRPAQPVRCGTVYIQTRSDDAATCRCGAPAVGECTECTRAVCADHSDVWQGWRVCDRDLANARLRARAAALTEERRREAEAAAAEVERRRQRSTLLELTDEEALRLLHVRGEPRSEQAIRSAVHTLRGLTADEFTAVCLALLPRAGTRLTARNGLTRLTGWQFTGPDFHGRSWLLTRKGEWYRSGSYGPSAAKAGRWRKIRFDDVEKRAVIEEMSWQQRVDNGPT